MDSTLQWETFEEVIMEVGVIIEVHDFPEARKPAFILHVNFGNERGILKTSAQITKRYSKDNLIGKRIVGVVNFPPKQIGPMISDFLLLGALDAVEGTALLEVESDVPLGSRIA